MSPSTLLALAAMLMPAATAYFDCQNIQKWPGPHNDDDQTRKLCEEKYPAAAHGANALDPAPQSFDWNSLQDFCCYIQICTEIEVT